MQIETNLSPGDLLKELKDIERALGRMKTEEKGPRIVDLDILLYNNQIVSNDTLTIPHASMLEREFVLRPLCDIAPNRAHPLTSTAFKHHLAAVPPPPVPFRTYVSISPKTLPLDPSNPRRYTLVMAVLNLTPDSFSDGGKYMDSNVVSTVKRFIASGASIIDIGGQSTRPGAQDVGEEKELRRIIPAIEAIRKAGIDIPISVDTYRAVVARKAVEAGANIINDISAGLMDPEMLSIVAKLGVPIVLMHTRGTPETMNSLTQYSDVVVDVSEELQQRVHAAEEAGIRRWNILLDPGLGFAKNVHQNLELIRRLRELTGSSAGRLGGLPWVLGPSRKRFVGLVTGVDAAGERQWGTAGAVAACVAGGADVVRVHDVDEMKKVVDMAVAIWRA
jgi:dihydroneopterin aldolase/2-amino-4-hydroxy-6-hydroxymethyldihydropteridine diphosphokinase/dihydropteroate synthase